MPQHVLILGPTGRFGRHASQAFTDAGWRVSHFNRARDDLMQAARGVDVIVNGWNPPYDKWQSDLPGQTREIIDAARRHGATVLFPGNVYVYGKGSPELLAPDTPHRARNPLGRLRIEMEAAYRASGVPTIVLRAGDFIDTEASGNWFDRVIVGKLDRGVFTYLGPMNVPHAWAFLPDLGRAAVALAEMRGHLARFQEVSYPGFTLTGEDLAQALERALGRKLARRRFSYLPIRLAAPFWPLGRHLAEMRYLWAMPHRLDRETFAELLPNFTETPLEQALLAARGQGQG